MTATAHLQLTLYIYVATVYVMILLKEIHSNQGKWKNLRYIITKSLYLPRLEGHTHMRAANQSVAPRVDLEVEI